MTTCAGFDCSSHTNDLDATPSSVTCAADPCTGDECCTVVPVVPVAGTNAGGSNSGADITVLEANLSSLTTQVNGLETKVTGLETTLNEVRNDVTTMMGQQADDASEGWFSWNPLTWFDDGEVAPEGFSNKNNNLFFVLAMIIIIYYCLKK